MTADGETAASQRRYFSGSLLKLLKKGDREKDREIEETEDSCRTDSPKQTHPIQGSFFPQELPSGSSVSVNLPECPSPQIRVRRWMVVIHVVVMSDVGDFDARVAVHGTAL